MDLEALGQWMVRRGVLDRAALVRARQRQRLYGGTLDTALLELGLCDERTIEVHLAETSGLDAGERGWLDAADPEVATLLDAAMARKLGAQPVALAGDTLQIAVRLGADLGAVADWAARRSRGTSFRIVPEIRLEALWARVHRVSAPTRFARLLGKLVGAEKAHRSTRATPAGGVTHPLVETGPLPAPAPVVAAAGPAAPAASAQKPSGPAPRSVTPEKSAAVRALRKTHVGFAFFGADLPPASGEAPPAPAAQTRPTPAASLAVPASAPLAPVAELEAPAIDIVDDLEESLDELLPLLDDDRPGSPEQLSLLRRLRPFAADARVVERVAAWRARVAQGDQEAARALGALGDRQAVPALIELLAGGQAGARQAALTALRAITLHDFGRFRWRWTRWWREFQDKHAVEWLLDALGSSDPELRLEAARQLERLSGRHVGYHFDLGKRDRDEARRRWEDWWQTTGKTGAS